MSALLENKAAMTTVQRITEVISRRRKTFAFEGVLARTTVSDIPAKLTSVGAIAN